MQEIEEVLYQLKVTDEAVTNLFEKGLGISLTRYMIVRTLLKESPLHQQALQERLSIDRAAITRHLKVLEETGYVRRWPNPASQREMLVEPTDKARQDLIVAPVQQHLLAKQAMSDVLSSQERELLKNLLTKLLAGLQELPITD